MALLSKEDMPTSLVKSGSAIELYLSFKRSTNDIDTNIDLNDLNKLLKSLKNKYNPIFFEILNEQELESNLSKNKINILLLLKPKTLKRLEYFKEILNSINEIKLTLNGTYSKQELKEIIDDFKVTKRVLKIVKSHALVFTSEMLVAEKYQSLISKNKNSTRTKDLIDLYFLISESKDFNYDKFFKWFFRKWENSSRDSKNKEEVISYIKNNKDIELTKIKENFHKVLELYEIKIDYEKALEVYKNISNVILDRFSK